jgi:hypothetical protein
MTPNIPEDSLLWDAESAAREFRVGRSTVFKKFKAAGLIGSQGVRTVDVISALFGDAAAERTKLLRAQRKLAEKRLKAFGGDLLPATEVNQMLADIYNLIKRELEQTHVTEAEYGMILLGFKRIPDGLEELVKKARKKATAIEDDEEEDDDE